MICGIRLLSFKIDLNEKFAHVLSVPLQSLLGNYVSVYGLKAISTEKLWRRLTKIPSLRWCRIKKTGHYLFLSGAQWESPLTVGPTPRILCLSEYDEMYMM